MSVPATAFVTYLWHYLAARLVYDELVRPLAHGHVPSALVLAAAAGGAGFALGHRARRGT